jgi:hypothetical protein
MVNNFALSASASYNWLILGHISCTNESFHWEACKKGLHLFFANRLGLK